MRNSPGILTFSIDENMRPKLDWLRERMGLDADGIRKMVGRNARVLSLKVRVCDLRPCFGALHTLLLFLSFSALRVILPVWITPHDSSSGWHRLSGLGCFYVVEERFSTNALYSSTMALACASSCRKLRSAFVAFAETSLT